MFEQYYNFAGRPFQLTPDPKFYFESATHRKAMSYLGYGLAQGEGLIVITGDIGAGKTTLVGHLMATIDPQRLTAVRIASTHVDGETMLRLAAHAFGIATDDVEKAHVLSRIEAFMHHQARAGRRSLLIVDEAQNLSFDALEALRMLSNFQLGGQSLVQIFLLGQPEFRQTVAMPTLEQLRQRIIATHHLDPMQPEEVKPYVEHRLKVVGWTGNPAFSPEIYALLAQASGGVPRRLNALVRRVLEHGAQERQDRIDPSHVEQACADLGERYGAAPEPAASHAGMPLRAEAPAAPPPSPAATAQLTEERQAIRAEVRSLRAEIDQAPPAATRAAPAAPSATGDIDVRLGRLEARLDEQEEMLRRIMSRLIEWMEKDMVAEPVSHRAA